MTDVTHTYSLHTASTGVKPTARAHLDGLYAAVQYLPDDAERGWWLDNIDAVWPAIACCGTGEVLCPEAATHIAGMVVEGSRFTAFGTAVERLSVGRAAVLLGVACGVVEVLR